MKKIISVLFILSIFIPSCSNENLVNPQVESTGGISLSIDKANAPEDVKYVKAALTRENYEPIVGMMDIHSNNTAEINFNNINVGQWHLKVEALDSNNVVLYVGEADVVIQENFITQVSLTLVPVSHGTGSIHIYVTWGNPNHNKYSDYYHNPVMTTSQAPNSPLYITTGKIINDNGLYRFYYNNIYNSAQGNIGYAVSSDGINWEYPLNHPILERGQPGSWDARHVIMGAILKDVAVYRMYYVGCAEGTYSTNIGYAQSWDGINWEKRPTPLMMAEDLNHRIGSMEVIKVGTTYYMYYGVGSSIYRELNKINSEKYVKVATSQDGINFTPQPGSIIQASEYWESGAISFVSVIYENGKFKMIYMNASETAFGYAVSVDGIHWEKLANPVFSENDTYNHWAYMISYPTWIKINNEYRIYYTGTKQNGELAIGFCKKPQ
ncbi:MAG: hypothetical protein ACM3O3_02560 [Syntrophothermus sp.]